MQLFVSALSRLLCLRGMPVEPCSVGFSVSLRTGFTALLELTNEQDTPLTSIRVDLFVRKELDSTGPLLNDLFSIQAPEFTGDLDRVDGTGTLPANGKGSVSWLLIPFRSAAPSPASEFYEVSGELAYVSGGDNVAIPLWPDSIEVCMRLCVCWPPTEVQQVLPDPLLRLSYFWQRQVLRLSSFPPILTGCCHKVYGDDPFTPEIETPQEFSLAITVRNDGNGTARNFRITSNQVQDFLTGCAEC